MMKLYNALSKSIEDFVPIDSSLIKVYSCGPTVYDSAHIGNLSAYVYADVLRRVLSLAGYPVKHVMNVTDVDDKTIRESVKAYPDKEPQEALAALTSRVYQSFLLDLSAVGNDAAGIEFIRATDSIDAIQKLIISLLDTGVAYVADDGIYFSIEKYSTNRKYGQLSKIELPSNTKSRINNDEYDKESAQDFALWKSAQSGEPAWDFEVNGDNILGRPGWHIECSAMSVQGLGQPFDIHTGGIDLVFPHHENEIAQSTAGNQPEKLANYFVHNGHLLVDGAKMSKSKNNFYTMSDITARDFGPLDFRMLILQGHYQKSVNFSWDNLGAAARRLSAWRAAAELRWQTTDVDDDGQQTMVRNLLSQASDALLDNINTPEALKLIDQAIDLVTHDVNSISHEALLAIFDFTNKNLGFDIYGVTPSLPDDIRNLIIVREAERTNGDYAKADEIRDALIEQGVTLRDTSIGVIWSR